MSAARRLVLVSPSLGVGGAERVVQLLARGFLSRGHQVTVVTTTHKDDFFDLPTQTERVRLDLTGTAPGTGARLRNLHRTVPHLVSGVLALRRTIANRHADLTISFMDETNVISLCAAWGICPVAVTEHSDPGMRRAPVATRGLRRLWYPRAACLVSVSDGVDRGFSWLDAARRRVIHNPVDVPPGPARPPDGFVAGRYVVGMGRLHRAKGFDLLLRAFAQFREQAPEWKLAVLGEGPERLRLEREATELGLGGAVRLLGVQRDPFPVLRAASFFVLPSRWEGFGNVLVEAMACGLPTVGYACPSGPAEIIEHEHNGLLVPSEDVAALTEGMLRLIKNPAFRDRLATNAPATANRFTIETIVRQWEEAVFPLARLSRHWTKG